MRGKTLFFILLIVLVAIPYSQIFQYQFLFDDEFLIEKNTFLRSFEHLGKLLTSNSTAGFGGIDNFYRPLQGLSYWVIYQIAGLDPIGFHVLNLSLHLINVLLVFALGLQFHLKREWAFLMALLWGLHPVHPESVTYMSATADTMYSFFVLLGCLWVVQGKSLLWILGIGVFALLAKESAAVFPLLCWAALFLKRSLVAKSVAGARVGWLFVPVLIYVGLRATVLNFKNSFNLFPNENIYTESVLVRLYTFLATLPEYLKMLIYPRHLHMEREFPVFPDPVAPPVFWGLLILLLASASVVYGWRRQKPWFVFTPLWFFSAHVLHTGILIPVNALLLEHWMYLPSLSLFWALGYAGGLLNYSPLRTGAMVTTGLVAAFLAVLTFQQNQTWENSITFYSHILKYERGTPRVLNNLGMAYSDQNNPLAAMEVYERSMALDPTAPQPVHNLALLHLNQKNRPLALRYFEEAIRRDPYFYHSMAYLVEIYESLGDKKKSEEWTKRYYEARKRFPGS